MSVMCYKLLDVSDVLSVVESQRGAVSSGMSVMYCQQ